MLAAPSPRGTVLHCILPRGHASWTEQGSIDYAVEELKKQAAAIGANGVLLTVVAETGGGRDSAQTVSGEAIYVNGKQ